MNAIHVSRRAAAVLALLACAGCSGTFTSERYDQANPISVETAPQILELSLSERMSAAEERRISAFARNYLLNGRGELTLAYPDNADGALVERTMANVARGLKANGVPTGRLVRGPYAAAEEGDRGMVLSYQGVSAFGSGCPNEWGDSTRDYTNQTPERFGCAAQTNLAVMIDNPADLVEPRPSSPAYNNRRDLTFSAYRTGEAPWIVGSEESSSSSEIGE